MFFGIGGLGFAEQFIFTASEYHRQTLFPWNFFLGAVLDVQRAISPPGLKLQIVKIRANSEKYRVIHDKILDFLNDYTFPDLFFCGAGVIKLKIDQVLRSLGEEI
jgi:hypothetical protein